MPRLAKQAVLAAIGKVFFSNPVAAENIQG